MKLFHLVFVILVPGYSVAGVLADSEQPVSFARDVRPILSDRCFHCHGPDRITREADLRLDQEDVVLGDREIVVPGDLDASELIARITSDDEELLMPPQESHLKLTPEEIHIFKRWVSQGAKWEKHWAFISPTRPAEPDVSLPNWRQNPIDRFVMAKLDAEGIEPSPEADRRVLIRRVSLDLTGLPPTPSEVRAFLNDGEHGAWERVVDRLLASTAYGERMALPWLEAARYADTSGYQEDYGRFMHPWRTWVINAFNSNMPFNQFAIEQLAGDLLPDATPEQVLATAFNRNHRINQEIGSINEEYLNEYAIDRVETVGTVFLGSTIGCARCHDHKYDPITQKEFYEFLAFFNNNDDFGVDQQSRMGYCRPFIHYVPPEDQPALNALERQLADLKGRSEQSEAERQPFNRWLNEFDQVPPLSLGTWHVVGPLPHPERTLESGLEHVFPLETAYSRSEPFDLTAAYGGVKFARRPKLGDGILQTVGGAYSTFFAYQTIHTPEAQALDFDVAASDAYRVFLNGELADERRAGKTGLAESERVTLKLKAGDNRLLVKFINGDEIQSWGVHFPDRSAYSREEVDLIAARSNLNDEQRARAFDIFHKWRTESLDKRLADFRERYPKVMVMKEREKVRPAHILSRGNYADRLEEVQRSTPSVLPAFPDDLPKNRLGLARWMTSPDHPLLGRVTVNRFWQMYFGAGLVKTAEDFGLQSEWPSHPDLLDWLATEFVSSGWNVKHIQKLIVTSATYRQSSAVDPDLLTRDPENRLLARGPRQRLRPQFIRDQALYVSGLMVDRVGGASVKPYQPAGLWREVSNPFLPKIWFLTNAFEQDHDDRLYRKSLYTFWKRSVPPPNMTVFGAGTREACSVRSDLTNTPLQAMVLLNDVTFVEASRHLAYRMLTHSQDDAARLAWGMELMTSRLPDSEEAAVLRRALDRHRAIYLDDPEAAEEMLAHGESDPIGNEDPSEYAAWMQVALMLLNLDESITRQ